MPAAPTLRLLPALACAALLLAGCDQLGIESASAVAGKREAEGKAVGGACRHAGRAIEDCYGLNKKAEKAAVFAGWREMNDYMRENKLEAVAPQGANDDGAKPAADQHTAKADRAAEPEPAVKPTKKKS